MTGTACCCCRRKVLNGIVNLLSFLYNIVGYWGPLLSELYWAHPGNVAGINLVNLVCMICNLIHFMNRRLLARSWAVSHRSAGAQHLVSEPVHLRDASLIPKGRSGQDGTFKCADLRKKCGFMANLQTDESHEVLGHNEHGTVGEDLRRGLC